MLSAQVRASCAVGLHRSHLCVLDLFRRGEFGTPSLANAYLQYKYQVRRRWKIEDSIMTDIPAPLRLCLSR